MVMNRALTFMVVCCLCMGCISSPAHAWELDMGGGFSWVWEVRQQSGSKGFFGPYNIDNGSSGTAGNLNFWNGGQYDTNFTSGGDAGWSYINAIFDPSLRINQAIKLKARLRLGQYGNPVSGNYQTQDAPGVTNAFSEGQWTMFWATAQLPWGTVGIGKRPWEFGTGLQYDGSDSLTTESIAMVVPYGPLEFGFGIYPYRFVGTSGISTPNGDGYYPDPYDLPENIVPQYYSRADRSGTTIGDLLAFVTYAAGPLEMGVLGAYGSYHIGPEAGLNDINSLLRVRRGLDSDYFHGTAFARYNNGRFFANAEGAWVNWTDRFLRYDPTEPVPTNPRYVEQFRYMVEAGMLAGPGKLTFIYAWTPGPDRRAGAFIDKQSAAFVWHPTYDTHLGNFSLFRPYSYLFAYNHGSGLNAYNLSGNGYLRDAQILAARLDYAVAANLNVYGTFFSAQRTSHGYAWGCLAPYIDSANNSLPDGNLNILNAGSGLSGVLQGNVNAPNIPDTALGYEITAGLEWNLLENWTFTMLGAYWQPGRWFNYACVDRSVPGWDNPNAANNYGIRPNRTIDAVTATEVGLLFSF